MNIHVTREEAIKSFQDNGTLVETKSCALCNQVLTANGVPMASNHQCLDYSETCPDWLREFNEKFVIAKYHFTGALKKDNGRCLWSNYIQEPGLTQMKEWIGDQIRQAERRGERKAFATIPNPSYSEDEVKAEVERRLKKL